MDREEAAAVIDQVEAFAGNCLEQYASRMFFCSDESYIRAGRDLPEEEYYEGYVQLENGVGMLRLLGTEVKAALEERAGDDRKLRISAATGKLAAPYLRQCMDAIHEKFPRVNVEVHEISNRFFGERITVSGLITGQDLKEQLTGQDLGERLLIPCNMLRSGEDVFLDDMTVEELSEALNTEIVVADEDGADLVSSVLDPPDHKKQIRRQMYEQTSSSDRGKA